MPNNLKSLTISTLKGHDPNHFREEKAVVARVLTYDSELEISQIYLPVPFRL